MSGSAPTQADLQALSDNYTSLNHKLSSTVQTLQTLEAQRTENVSVSREFDKLDFSAKIYKLVGPVLVKQGLEEAKSTVDGRKGFIEGQIQEVEKQITDIKGQQEKLKGEIIHLQSQMQQQEQQ